MVFIVQTSQERIVRDRLASYRRHPTLELETLTTKSSNNNSSRSGFNPLMPRRAPEGLGGSARRGDAGMHRVFGGLWIALPKTPFKPFGAQDQSGMGRTFFWVLFFGRPKKSTSAVGPRPDIKKSRRVSDTKSQLDAIHGFWIPAIHAGMSASVRTFC